MATGVGRGEILTTSSKSPDPKIGGVGANSTQLFFMGTELYRFEVSIGHNAIFLNWGKIGKGVIRFLSQTNWILLFEP